MRKKRRAVPNRMQQTTGSSNEKGPEASEIFPDKGNP
jgi:hypothetical protein